MHCPSYHRYHGSSTCPDIRQLSGWGLAFHMAVAQSSRSEVRIASDDADPMRAQCVQLRAVSWGQNDQLKSMDARYDGGTK